MRVAALMQPPAVLQHPVPTSTCWNIQEVTGETGKCCRVLYDECKAQCEALPEMPPSRGVAAIGKLKDGVTEGHHTSKHQQYLQDD